MISLTDNLTDKQKVTAAGLNMRQSADYLISLGIPIEECLEYLRRHYGRHN